MLLYLQQQGKKMSKSSHEKSTYRLRKLPKCSRCKIEFVLVLFSYGKGKKAIEEWECQKCQKTVSKRLLKEEEPSKDEQFLARKCKELDEERKTNRRRNRRKALRSFINSKDK